MNSQEHISFPIGIIVSLFNRTVTSALQDGAIQRLHARGFAAQDILIIEVPGAIEIPIIAKQLANSSWAQVIIVLGAVIRGETSHYDIVCQQVSHGCQSVSLMHSIPVVFGILTTDNELQAIHRAGGVCSNKGVEAVDCAISMYKIQNKIAAWNAKQ